MQKVSFKQFIKLVILDIFYISFLSWLAFFALDLIEPGFVVNYINLNYILILAIVSGIIEVVNKSNFKF